MNTRRRFLTLVLVTSIATAAACEPGDGGGEADGGAPHSVGTEPHCPARHPILERVPESSGPAATPPVDERRGDGGLPACPSLEGGP